MRKAREIVALACAIAKGPGMVVFGGQMLNVVLDDLVRLRDLMVNRVTLPLTVGANAYGPFALPADYLRPYDLFYQIPASGGATASSITIFLTPVTMEQFDAEFKSPSISNYPYEFANDLSTDAQTWSGGSQGVGTLTSAGNLFLYPQSSGGLTLTHRYMKVQPQIVSPESSDQVPWFPYDSYLITATAAKMMEITGDDRWERFNAQAEMMLKPYLVQEGSEQQAVKSVRLDPRHFHFQKGLKPTKAAPF